MSVPQSGSFRIETPRVDPANLWRFGPHGWPFYSYLTATANFATGEGRVSLQEFRAGYPISESTMGRVRAHLEEIGEVEFMDVRKGYDKTVCVEFRLVHYVSGYTETGTNGARPTAENPPRGRTATDWAERYAAYRAKAEGKKKAPRKAPTKPTENDFTSHMTADGQDLPSPVTGDTTHLPAPVTGGGPDLPSPVTTITPEATTLEITTPATTPAGVAAGKSKGKRAVKGQLTAPPLFADLAPAAPPPPPAPAPARPGAWIEEAFLRHQADGHGEFLRYLRVAKRSSVCDELAALGVTPERLTEVLALPTLDDVNHAVAILRRNPTAAPAAVQQAQARATRSTYVRGSQTVPPRDSYPDSVEFNRRQLIAMGIDPDAEDELGDIPF